MNFDDYLPDLIDRESDKAEQEFKDPRAELRTLAGVNLNWLGDYVDLDWSYREINTDDILFTGTSPEWNDLLLKRCQRKPAELRDLLATDQSVRHIIASGLSDWFRRFSAGEIMLRKGNEDGQWKVLDGMPEFVKAIIAGAKTVTAFVPTNEDSVRPQCEKHTVYDLIKAYERRGHDEAGYQQLVAGLRLLCREYDNVESLLRDRFDPAKRNMPDDDVGRAIAEVLS